MKFRLGPPPETDSFAGQERRWCRLREPGIWALQMIAIGAAMVAVGGVFAILLIRDPKNFPDVSWLAVILLILPSIPIHELLHAILFPGGPISQRVTIGFYPKAIGFYAHYDGVISKRRYIIIAAGPFLLLTVLPLTVQTVFMPELPYLLELILTNALLSPSDVLAIIFVVRRAPNRSLLINVGMRTYWSDSANKPEEQVRGGNSSGSVRNESKE